MSVGKAFCVRSLSKEQRSFCSRVISSDAFAALILDKLARKKGASVLRMADGEKALIDAYKGLPLRPFLKDEAWLKKYGLAGIDLTSVGETLLEAGMTADYLAPAITGVFRPNYAIYQHFLERRNFVDQFYLIYWHATGVFATILRGASVAVVHRNAGTMAASLQSKYALTSPIECITVDSWRDHANVEQQVKQAKARLVLVSAGPTGKAMIVRMARARPDQVVLDVGGAMEHTLASTSPKSQVMTARMTKYVTAQQNPQP